MLDFYFISDEMPKPNSGTGTLNFAGSLSDTVFRNLQKKAIIDYRFDYYSDFRWSKTVLEQIHRNLEARHESDTDVKQLLQIINPAIQQQSGLITFGD